MIWGYHCLRKHPYGHSKNINKTNTTTASVSSQSLQASHSWRQSGYGIARWNPRRAGGSWFVRRTNRWWFGWFTGERFGKTFRDGSDMRWRGANDVAGKKWEKNTKYLEKKHDTKSCPWTVNSFLAFFDVARMGRIGFGIKHYWDHFGHQGFKGLRPEPLNAEEIWMLQQQIVTIWGIIWQLPHSIAPTFAIKTNVMWCLISCLSIISKNLP